jgi:hypothetical protein
MHASVFMWMHVAALACVTFASSWLKAGTGVVHVHDANIHCNAWSASSSSGSRLKLLRPLLCLRNHLLLANIPATNSSWAWSRLHLPASTTLQPHIKEVLFLQPLLKLHKPLHLWQSQQVLTLGGLAISFCTSNMLALSTCNGGTCRSLHTCMHITSSPL